MAGNSSLGRQFRATHTWNVLVMHLKENAIFKRRRNLRKIFDECFTGANAVDVLHQCVKTRPEQFKNAISVSRENIVRLCQSFLDMNIVCRIMENDVDKVDKFEDSSTSLYVFVADPDATHCNTAASGRQALREIDGDIRNSLGHISISNRKAFISKHSSLSLRSKKRPQVPTFGGVTSSTSKESIANLNQNNGERNAEESEIKHPLKRTSTLVRRVVKRSTSDPNLRKSAIVSSSTVENDEELKKKTSNTRPSVRLRFSQRLSFRKKSISSDLPPEFSDEDDDVFRDASTVPQSAKTSKTCSKLLPDPGMKGRTRRSLHDTLTNPTKTLRHMISSPNLLTKMMHRTQSYDIDSMAQDKRCSTTNQECPTKRPMHTTGEDCPSPVKIYKTESINETPTRFKPSRSSLLHPFSNFASNISMKRRSLRKSERSRKSDSACVLTNTNVKDTLERTNEEKNGKLNLKPEDIARIQKECVRVRLLQILDMPFIDDVITSPVISDCTSNKNSGVNSNEATAASENSFRKLRASYNCDDKWVSSALTVLRHDSSSYGVLKKIVRQESDYSMKIQLYFAVYDHYKAQKRPLIPASMFDLLSEVVRSLETKPVSESLEVVQLFLNLLPAERIQELRNLVTFLNYVMTSEEIVVSSKCNNKMLILQTFPSIIFPINENLVPDDISRGPAGLFQFLLENYSQAFTLPSIINVAVERKQQLLESGQIDSPSLIRDSSSSYMISPQDYNEEKVNYTQKQLSELAKFVASDATLLPPRKKKDFLKKLQHSHPSAYATLRQPLKASHMLFFSSDSSRKLPKAPGTGTLTRRQSKGKGV